MSEKERIKDLLKDLAKVRDQENKILSEIWEIIFIKTFINKECVK